MGKAATKNASIVKAMSVRQPFAELIILGVKKAEYRSRLTNFRGPVWVYAGKTFGGYNLSDDQIDALSDLDTDPECLPRGVILGSVEIVDCRWLEGDGCYEYVLANPKRLRKPIAPLGTPQPLFWTPTLPA